jgi:hypothetical protein
MWIIAPLRFPLAVLSLGLSLLSLKGSTTCHYREAPVTITELALRNVTIAVAHYRSTNAGHCPATIGELRVRRYLISRPVDGWRGALRLHCRPGAVEVRSAGADSVFDTSDDVGSWTF